MKADKVRDLLWDEYSSNFTPDLTRLRYNGPIPVLLYGQFNDWDKMNDFMKDRKLTSYADYDTLNWQATTKQAFVQLEASPVNQYKEMLAAPADVPFLTPLRVRGRLMTLSLKGIRALDFFWYNGSDSQRIAVPLDGSYGGVKKYDWAFVYVHNKRCYLESSNTLKKGVLKAQAKKVGEDWVYG